MSCTRPVVQITAGASSKTRSGCRSLLFAFPFHKGSNSVNIGPSKSTSPSPAAASPSYNLSSVKSASSSPSCPRTSAPNSAAAAAACSSAPGPKNSPAPVRTRSMMLSKGLTSLGRRPGGNRMNRHRAIQAEVRCLCIICTGNSSTRVQRYGRRWSRSW